MLALRAHRLSFSYSDSAAILAGVDLHIAPGWVGVVGANGAGKTTFLRLVTGDLSPSEGSITIDPEGSQVWLCPQAVEQMDPGVLELASSEDKPARRIMGSLRLDPAELARWETLSPGERKRWQIGAALAAEPAVLLLDEPTNHIDGDARARLIDALRRFRGIGLVVSHDRSLLNELTTSTLRVQRGEARLYRGGYADARRTWEAEEQGLIDAHHRVREEERALRRRLDDTRRSLAETTADRSTGKRMKGPKDSDARGILANNKVEYAEAKIGRSARVLRDKLAEVSAEASSFHIQKGLGRSIFVDYVRSPTPWLFTIDEPVLMAGSAPILHDVRLSVGRESRIRIEGPNGAGKTTLLEALLRHARVPEDKVLYVPQEIGEDRERGLLDEVRSLPPRDRGRVLSLVAALGIDPDRLLASKRPSPGEARKLMIALGLGRHVWALALDEPTNHMDLPSIERLEEALASYPGALLLVTHDASFSRRAASTLWRVERGAVSIASPDPDPAEARA
jgi:ATPase subunit of ABC transporter with duplicated ATPase domains